MNARRILPLAAIPFLLSCADLGRNPVVTVDAESLDLKDLRRIYADLPPSGRPALVSRPERLAFVESVVRRRFLAEYGKTLAPDSAAVEAERRDREDVLLRRLQAIEAGMGDFTRAEVDSAASHLGTALLVRRILFRDPTPARAAFERITSGAPVEAITADSSCHILDPETLTWIPWPVDPIVEAVAPLDPGSFAPPLEHDGWAQLVQLVERTPHAGPGSTAAGAQLDEAVRRRRRALALQALDRRLENAAVPRRDDAAVRLVAERTGAALLESALAESDPEFGIPRFDPQESARTLVTFRIGGHERRISVDDYIRALRRQIPGRRPARGPLEGHVRRFLNVEIGRRLLIAEAERTRIATEDWWARRELARLAEERLVRLAIRGIERAAAPASDSVDSLVAIFVAAEPSLLRRPTVARLLRADFANESDARAERDRVLEAGGMAARFAQLLSGRAVAPGTYRHARLVPGGTGSAEIEAALFGRPPGEVLGPFGFGSSWIVLECLAIEPGGDRSPEDVRREVRESLSDGRRAAAVEEWVRERRETARVTIDEDLLDGLAPGI